jgi:hypothetical protein
MKTRKTSVLLYIVLAVLTMCWAVSSYAQTVPPAPRLWLGFNGNFTDAGTSTLTHSVLGTNLSGSYDGSFVASVANGTCGSDSVSLPGSGSDESFVQVTNVGNLNFDTGHPFTITAWINMGTSDSGPILAKSPNDNGGSTSLLDDMGAQAFELFVGGDLSPGRGQVTVGNFGVWEIESDASVNDGLWHHVAVTYDGNGNWSLFIDGNLDNTGNGDACNEADMIANGDPALGPWPLSIGYAGNLDFPATDAGLDGGQFDTTTMNGKIDEVAVWDACLSADQITSVYSSGVPLQTIDITQEPANVGKFTSQTATFNVVAHPVNIAGSLSYQWMSNGVSIVGEPSALTASYTTPTLTSSYNGAQYSCLLTVGSVSVLSQSATLTAVTPVLPPAPTLWLGFNNSLTDLGTGTGAHLVTGRALTNSYDGTFSTDVANSTCGSDSLSLTGSDTDQSYINVTNINDLNFDTGHPLTISFWVNTDGANNGAICGKSPDDGGASDSILDDTGSAAFSIFVGADGTFPHGQVTVGNYGEWEMESLGSVSGGWNHVVVTYDGKGGGGSQGTEQSQGTWSIYINGFLDNSTSGNGANEAKVISNGGSPWPLTFGYGGNAQFPSVGDGELDTTTLNAKIDEVAVWNKCLSPDQAAYVYVYGVPPESINITLQPTNAPATAAGATATFHAAAVSYGFSATMNYQWMSNGVVIPGATSQTYTTPALPASVDGSDYTITYTCQFTAGAFTVLSSPAMVTVITPAPAPMPALWLPFNGSLTDYGIDGVDHMVLGTNISGSYTGTFTNDVANSSCGSGSLHLSGDESFVEVNNVGELNFDDGPFTMSAWINPEGVDGNPFLAKSPAGGVSYLWHVFQAYVGSDPDIDSPHFQVTIGTYYDWDGQSIENVSSGGWTHVAMTYDGSVWNLYINGNLDSTFTAGACNEGDVIDDSGPWPFLVGYVGSTDQFQDATWTGKIDEVAVWTTALSGGQVHSVYQYGIRPTLSIVRSDSTHVLVSWEGSNLKLQKNANLANQAGWSDVPGGNSSGVSVTIGPGSQFFRLVNQ